LFAYFFNNIYLLFFCGVSWELIENLASKITKKKKSLNQKHTVINQDKTITYTNWWAGSFQDIIVNSIGLYHGFMIKNIKYFNTINLAICLYFYYLCLMKLRSTLDKNYIYFINEYGLLSRIFMLFAWIINPNVMLLMLFPVNYLFMYIAMQLLFLTIII